MREKVRDKGRLLHILSAIDTLMDARKRYTLSDIEGDAILFFGFVKHVEIIGEAVYMLSKEFKARHNDVEWDAIEGMRHVLVHGYYTVRAEQLWNTVEYDIPKLKPLIEKYIADETAE